MAFFVKVFAGPPWCVSCSLFILFISTLASSKDANGAKLLAKRGGLRIFTSCCSNTLFGEGDLRNAWTWASVKVPWVVQFMVNEMNPVSSQLDICFDFMCRETNKDADMLVEAGLHMDHCVNRRFRHYHNLRTPITLMVDTYIWIMFYSFTRTFSFLWINFRFSVIFMKKWVSFLFLQKYE